MKRENVVTLVLAAGCAVAAMLLASPDADAETSTVSVEFDGSTYEVPVCHVEDCSDQLGQVGVWFDPDSGVGWLSVGETSHRIER